LQTTVTDDTLPERTIVKASEAPALLKLQMATDDLLESGGRSRFLLRLRPCDGREVAQQVKRTEDSAIIWLAQPSWHEDVHSATLVAHFAIFCLGSPLLVICSNVASLRACGMHATAVQALPRHTGPGQGG
jgi:hypothetical protein